jgi:hypothetical protein
MSEAPTNRRRWFQFRMRTLLVFVLVGGVLCWGYWIGWPWWVAYRQRSAFESAVKLLKAGGAISTVSRRLSPSGDIPIAFPPPKQGHEFAMSSFELPGATYCVLFTLEHETETVSFTCTQLKVYRLPPMPPGYKRKAIEFPPAHLSKNKPHSGAYPQIDYTDDFFCFLTGTLKNNPGFKI